MNFKEFQKDLQNGMSVNEACRKHQVTLSQAITEIQKHERKQRGVRIGGKKHKKNAKYPTVARNIQKNHGFMVRKSINGKQEFFGRYTTLEEAILVRDYLNKHGWTKTNLNTIRSELGCMN